MLLFPARIRSPWLSTLSTVVGLSALLALAPASLALAGSAGVGPVPLPAIGGSLPLVKTTAVQVVLDQWRSDPEAAAWVRRGAESRESWRLLVDGALAAAGLPPQLAAVPLIESGYTNWGAEAGVGGRGTRTSMAPGIPGRGLWMFIAPTARVYGLVVDGERDDRLDPTMETAAAVALLGDLHERYGDWLLALAGYNEGARVVDAAIAEGGTHDVWALHEAGRLNEYVPTVVAAALVMADPAILDR